MPEWMKTLSKEQQDEWISLCVKKMYMTPDRMEKAHARMTEIFDTSWKQWREAHTWIRENK